MRKIYIMLMFLVFVGGAGVWARYSVGWNPWHVFVSAQHYDRVRLLESFFPDQYPYQLPRLPYREDELEPHLDQETIHIHYHFHHGGYVSALNKALEAFPDLQRHSLVYLLTHLHLMPCSIRDIIRRQGGGHFAHTFFWRCISPQPSQPSEQFMSILQQQYGSYEAFIEKFIDAGVKQFNGGWVWVGVDYHGQLNIITTNGHDTPLEQGIFPILVADVWEHAYYLKFQQKRLDFLKAWWRTIHWPAVEHLYDVYMKSR